MRRTVYSDSYDGSTPPKQVLDLIDLKDPTKPAFAGTMELPAGQFHTGLSAVNGLLVTSHAEEVPGQPGKVRFYLDQIDVANAAAPKMVGKINVPGSPLRFYGESGALVSVDYKKTSTPAASWEECFGKDAYYYGGYNKWFDEQAKICVSVSKIFRLSSIKDGKATLLDSTAVDGENSTMQQVVFAKNRLFGMTYTYNQETGNTQRIVSLGGFQEGKFTQSEQVLEVGQSWYYGSYNIIGTSDERAVLMSYSNENNIFTLDPAAPGDKLTDRGALRSWPSEVRVAGDKVIASLQDRGVQVISLK
jgi:hypothetical protein